MANNIAIVSSAFGNSNTKRVDKFLKNLCNQSGFSLFIPSTICLNDVNFYSYDINVMNINETITQRGIWHKESLFNIGACYAISRGFTKIIFVDCDIHSRDNDWIQKISDLIYDNNVVHGFRVVEDTVDKDLCFQSPLAETCLNYHTDLPYNPGMCWGMTSDFFRSIDGFNTNFVYGGGDGAFFNEMFPNLNCIDTYDDLLRIGKHKCIPKCVDCDIVHVNHSMSYKKTYDHRNAAYDSIRNRVTLGGNGLMSWI